MVAGIIPGQAKPEPIGVSREEAKTQWQTRQDVSEEAKELRSTRTDGLSPFATDVAFV